MSFVVSGDVGLLACERAFTASRRAVPFEAFEAALLHVDYDRKQA